MKMVYVILRTTKNIGSTIESIYFDKFIANEVLRAFRSATNNPSNSDKYYEIKEHELKGFDK